MMSKTFEKYVASLVIKHVNQDSLFYVYGFIVMFCRCVVLSLNLSASDIILKIAQFIRARLRTNMY